ncbi:alanine--tRNA ligase [Chloroflexota bacterium]
MTGDEIRTAFLKFFEEKGHKIIPSSSLIPHGDPTLLLTSAGMVQMKPYFTGEAVPPAPRLASCQKCFRTTDIESVGDATHLTFFEMLGNFSVGDYFKKEAIAWGWEFVTRRLKLPPERLWITVYLDDDEAFNYWRETGVPDERILRFGDEDNFWGPAGSSGPCGPCSEIHYDFGEGVGCGQGDCKPNCGCSRFSEIWNLVFTEYNQDEAGQRTPLPKPNIDTGMGLERTVAAVNGQTSVYETGIFADLIKNISKHIGKQYGSDGDTDYAMRVVVEHGRAVTFLIADGIADGVLPSNEGRGYVMRRLIRRAALFGRRLGIEKSFLSQIAGATVSSMGEVYPELRKKQGTPIYQVIESEEARFRETLATGLELIEGDMGKKAAQQKKEISGADAFKLYDTYGFPVELTAEIVGKSGFTVDMAGFNREMEQQRERGRAAHRFENRKTSGLEKLDVEDTSFVGYHCLQKPAKIVKVLVEGNEVDVVGEGQPASLVLDETPFYGEMGGQVGDTGEIISPSGRFTVTDTTRVGSGILVHQGAVSGGSLAVGDEVSAEVDIERRLDIARNHTATHLLHLALRRVLGEHVQQRGSLVSPERLRFDFSHLEAMTPGEINEVERIVNGEIRSNLAVSGEESSYREAVDGGAIALFDEKYGDTVRVLKIGQPAVSAELCGGTHVGATGEIGYFHVVSEGGIGAGLRRIEAVTGRGAEALIYNRVSSLENIAQFLNVSVEEAEEKVSSTESEFKIVRKQALDFERRLAKMEVESLLGRVEQVKGINLVASVVSSSSQPVLREMADLIRDKLKSGVIVLAAVVGDKPFFLAAVTDDLVARGYNAGNIVREVAKVTGGGGGGKPGLAQAGGKDKARIDAALNVVKGLI